jgi:hypothetical protein
MPTTLWKQKLRQYNKRSCDNPNDAAPDKLFVTESTYMVTPMPIEKQSERTADCHHSPND